MGGDKKEKAGEGSRGSWGVHQDSRYVESIIKSMSDTLIVINPDTTIRSVNQSTLDLLGYQEDELVGRTIETVVEFEEEEGRIIFMETFMMGDLIDRDFISDYEMAYKSKDGRKIPVSLSGSIVRSDDGKMSGIVVVARDITRRKKAEQQIRGIIDAAPDVIHVISPDMRIINKNAESEKLFPYINVGDHCYAALHKRKEACPHCGVTKVFEDGEKHAHESKIKLPNGNTIMVYSTSSPIFDENGGIAAAVEILRDITRRKEAEQDLRMFSQAVEEAADAINMMDRDGNFIFVNPVFCKMHGYKKEELLGKSFLITIPEGSRDAAMAYFKDAISEKKKPMAYEGKSMRKDGRVIDVHGNWSYIYKDDKVNGTMAVLRDFTERNKADQRVRDIINAAPDIIHVISPDMKITTKNTASGKAFPHIKEGDHCYAALHKRKEPCPHCGVTKVFKDGEKQSHESAITLPDGSSIIVYSTSSPIFDEKGNVVAAVEMLHDITERKKAEAEIKKYAKELEAANRLKDLFTDIIRHDLLNPVDIIKNLTEMLAEDEKYKDSKDLQMILQSAKKTEEMIQNASRYAKLEDITELELEDHDLGSVIKFVIADFRPFLEMNNMKVEYNPQGEYPVKAISMIEDVFSNLLSNAIKYTPEGTTITIAIEDKGKSWLISFADQGEGVPDEYKESLFDRFTRRKKEGVKGSGLGLAIAQRIVDLHDGKIWIEDNPKGGAVFCVSLPK
ncbi:PAS domain S-box protein [archaeon]|nr:PAS domain S-box protein [archaeon]